MRRRNLLAVLGGVVAAPSISLMPARAAEPPLLVYFASASQAAASRWIGFLQQGLKERGYVEGQSYRLTGRFGDFKVDRLPSLAEEIVRLGPAIIVAGAVDTAMVARKASSTIPIVSGALADAVHLGLVASYPKPGGNVTGITPYVEGLPAKQIEFAREVVPGAQKIGLIGNMNDPKAPPQRDELTAAAKNFGSGVSWSRRSKRPMI